MNNPSLCLACGHAATQQELVCKARTGNLGRRVTFFVCAQCGYSSAPENLYDFETEGFDDNNDPKRGLGRTGSESTAGREYHMASMACDIIEHAGIASPSVLIFGAGLSLDHRRIARERPRSRISITDLDNFQGADNFLAMDDPTVHDIIVACEVIEHFTDPMGGFGNLLGKLSPSGLLVCSTNISDGTPLRELEYPFIGGHTSYYSARALAHITRSLDPQIEVDYRTPEAALWHLGPRKRYVLMYRAPEVRVAISEYFSRVGLAPSEPGRPPRMRIRVREFIRALRFTAQRLLTQA